MQGKVNVLLERGFLHDVDLLKALDAISQGLVEMSGVGI